MYGWGKRRCTGGAEAEVILARKCDNQGAPFKSKDANVKWTRLTFASGCDKIRGSMLPWKVNHPSMLRMTHKLEPVYLLASRGQKRKPMQDPEETERRHEGRDEERQADPGGRRCVEVTLFSGSL